MKSLYYIGVLATLIAAPATAQSYRCITSATCSQDLLCEATSNNFFVDIFSNGTVSLRWNDNNAIAGQLIQTGNLTAVLVTNHPDTFAYFSVALNGLGTYSVTGALQSSIMASITFMQCEQTS